MCGRTTWRLWRMTRGRTPELCGVISPSSIQIPQPQLWESKFKAQIGYLPVMKGIRVPVKGNKISYNKTGHYSQYKEEEKSPIFP